MYASAAVIVSVMKVAIGKANELVTMTPEMAATVTNEPQADQRRQNISLLKSATAWEVPDAAKARDHQDCPP